MDGASAPKLKPWPLDLVCCGSAPDIIGVSNMKTRDVMQPIEFRL